MHYNAKLIVANLSDAVRFMRRDDIPFPVAAQLEAVLRDQFPGCAISWTGDGPELTPAAAKRVAELKAELARRRTNGLCIDCETPMPNADAFRDGTVEAPDDWCGISDTVSTIGWQCPTCYAKEAATLGPDHISVIDLTDIIGGEDAGIDY